MSTWAAKPALYPIWDNIKQRCYNPRCKAFKNYGGRGITVCKRWLGPSGFRNFVKDVGARPSPEHTLGRKNNNRNYTPKNCRWETPTEQNKNARSNVRITANGKTQLQSEWAEETGFSEEMLYQRRKLGWTDTEIINTPRRAYPI